MSLANDRHGNLLDQYMDSVYSVSHVERAVVHALASWLTDTRVDAEMVLKKSMRACNWQSNHDRKTMSYLFLQAIVYSGMLEYIFRQVDVFRSSLGRSELLSKICDYENEEESTKTIYKQILKISDSNTCDLIKAAHFMVLYHYIHQQKLISSKAWNCPAANWSLEQSMKFWSQMESELGFELPSSRTNRMAVIYSLPLWLVEEWEQQFGYLACAQMAALCNEPGPLTLRVNTLLISCNRYMEILRNKYPDIQLAQGSRLSPWAIVLDMNEKPKGGAWAFPNWEDGYFEVQDQGSQLIALACGVQQGDSVLDFCAGTGGKSLALAAMVGRSGKVVCWDKDEQKLKHLMGNAKRAKMEDFVRITTEHELLDGGQVLTAYDCVLVDAPCSGTGILRRHPSHRWNKLDEKECKQELPQLQQEICLRAAHFVGAERGARLVYATCSLLRHENDQVADALDKKLAPMGLVRESFADGLMSHWILPWTLESDGFFVARWVRI